MNTPALSIIIPVYKVEAFMGRCVDSVLAQTLTDIEIILVDDGSPDACPALCDAYARRDSRIRVVHQDNQGLAGARNAGLALARGDYVAFLDADDWVTPEAYATLYAAALRHKADIVFCQARYFDDATQKIVEADDASSLPLFQGRRFSGSFTWRDIGVDAIFSYASFVVAWNKISKRTFLAELGIEFPAGLIYEDNPFYFQTIFGAKRLAAVPERLVTYRINRKDSIIQGVSAGKNARAMHILGIMAEIKARLVRVAPPEVLPAFYRYAFDEIRHKYPLIPEALRQKYLALAKGLLPPAQYWRLRFAIWIRKAKRCFSLVPLCIVRERRRRGLSLFGVLPLVTAEKGSWKSNEYDAVVVMGRADGQDTLPEKVYTGNAVLDCKKLTLSSFSSDSNISIATLARQVIVRIRPKQGGTAATEEEEAGFAAGRLALAETALLIDFSSPGLAASELHSLFYRLNCIFAEKTIHIIARTSTVPS